MTQQFQDLKITYNADGTTADNILLVLVDAKGNALSKFKVAVSASGFTPVGSSDDFKLTKKDGTIADDTTVTLRIKSVANYNGKISLQSATFKSGDTVVGTATATGGQLAGDPIYTISNGFVPSADLESTLLRKPRAGRLRHSRYGRPNRCDGHTRDRRGVGRSWDSGGRFNTLDSGRNILYLPGVGLQRGRHISGRVVRWRLHHDRLGAVDIGPTVHQHAGNLVHALATS